MKWWIYVHGYGAFEFEGSEVEAEEMRVHKARWERGIARKWQIALDGRFIVAEGKSGPPSRDHNGAQYEILAAEAAQIVVDCGADDDRARVEVERSQHYRGLSREWWRCFWTGWEGISASEGDAQDTGIIARQIYDTFSETEST